jgi:hypothetical protein
MRLPDLSNLPTGPSAAQSSRLRPVQTVLESVYSPIDLTSEKSFVESMLSVLTSCTVRQWVAAQKEFHVRMDLDLLSKRDDDNSATLHLFSVATVMTVKDLDWTTIKCTALSEYLKSDECRDGGSENKLFYRNAESLKQFVLSNLPLEERRAVLVAAFKLFVGSDKTPGFANIQTFSGIPFFHMKPFSLT